ncbi:hypothetical protein BDY24DRAFT_385975 [Mrakia frigida]|uniref:uncharacterized protein n=1 Tax=Mrakia frigida TaxID=29902 RepID=UPI003FCC0A58
MDTFPPTPSALLTFPQASLSHHLGSHSFPLSSGPCSLVELEGGQLALTIPPKTSVVIGKENLVKKVDQNQAHASYAFNYAPTTGGPSPTAGSSSGDGLLPSNNQEAGGFLKLTLPESKNSDQYDATTSLSRQFEALLLSHSPPLLDTRIAPEVADDQEETITAVLSSWWNDGLKGLKDTAGVVYTGVREQGGALLSRGVGVVAGGGAGADGKGKGKEQQQQQQGTRFASFLRFVFAPNSSTTPKPSTSSTSAPSTNAAVLHAEEAV